MREARASILDIEGHFPRSLPSSCAFLDVLAKGNRKRDQRSTGASPPTPCEYEFWSYSQVTVPPSPSGTLAILSGMEAIPKQTACPPAALGSSRTRPGKLLKLEVRPRDLPEIRMTSQLNLEQNHPVLRVRRAAGWDCQSRQTEYLRGDSRRIPG